jgi:hypothetical protein
MVDHELLAYLTDLLVLARSGRVHNLLVSYDLRGEQFTRVRPFLCEDPEHALAFLQLHQQYVDEAREVAKGGAH